MSHLSVAAATRRRKEANPEFYCRNPRCLYRTVRALMPFEDTPFRQVEFDGQKMYEVACPKHGGLKWDAR